MSYRDWGQKEKVALVQKLYRRAFGVGTRSLHTKEDYRTWLLAQDQRLLFGEPRYLALCQTIATQTCNNRSAEQIREQLEPPGSAPEDFAAALEDEREQEQEQEQEEEEQQQEEPKADSIMDEAMLQRLLAGMAEILRATPTAPTTPATPLVQRGTRGLKDAPPFDGKSDVRVWL